MTSFVGIDFGTTNSAVALAFDDARAQLVQLPTPSEAGSLDTVPTWRSVLFMEAGEGHGPEVSAGAMAIARYLETGGDGRFIQSVKSHLSSKLFNKTAILGRNYALEDLITAYLLQVRSVVPQDLGDTAVVGRPVRYWGAQNAEDDERALTRMRRGLKQAGFTNVVFEHEPVAAAAKYGVGIESEELVLIADFGGGTSDFCLLRMTPGQVLSEILATGGVGIGGDTFDGCIVDSVVAPLLGKGSNYSDIFGATTEVPRGVFSNLRRWHHLAFLKSKKTMALLKRVEAGAEFPERIERLIHVVENDLGLPLHQAVEGSKRALSEHSDALLNFCDDPIEIREQVSRDEFEGWIEPDLCRIDAVVDDVLTRASVKEADVHRVFTTGGSSFVPAVRRRLEQRFPGRLRGGEELTSVALGLAERAREVFGS
jgi:hypothetical chaperone protein